MDLWTVGHSTRSAGDFVSLLQSHGIELVADVRRYPGSRRYPHFNAEALALTLERAGIRYVPMPELGGRRAPRARSTNTAWRNASFRAYADYMETAGFDAAVRQLLAAAEERRTAIMCAEAVWWQCHRQMIADALKVRGIRVLHIIDGSKTTEHPYTAPARIVDGRLLYGPATDGLDRLWAEDADAT